MTNCLAAWPMIGASLAVSGSLSVRLRDSGTSRESRVEGQSLTRSVDQ